MKAEEQAFYKQVGAFLRDCRKEARISMEEAAECIGKHKSMISNIENGREPVNLVKFSKLLKLYGVKYVDTEMMQGLRFLLVVIR